MNGRRRDLHCIGVCLFLAWAGCGGAALAQSHVDDADSGSVLWAIGACMTAGAIGFGAGAKLRLTRDIANMG